MMIKNKKRFIKKIEIFNDKDDFKNVMFNSVVLMFFSIISLFTPKSVSYFLIFFGVVINLLYIIISYLTADKYFEEIE